MTNQKYKTYYHAKGNYIIKTTTKRNKVITIDRVIINNSSQLDEYYYSCHTRKDMLQYSYINY